MGRVFISAGHGGTEGGQVDPGTIAGGTTEAREMILIRDLILTDLRSRGLEVLSVPDDLSGQQTFSWINSRGQPGDIALEIHADAYNNPSFRGSAVYYIAINADRKRQADILLMALARRVAIPTRASFPDTASGLGSISFCRQVTIPALYMQIGFLTNPDDRFIIQNQRRDIATGISDGLVAWLRDSSGVTPTPSPSPTPNPNPGPNPVPSPTPIPPGIYPAIKITINGQVYGEQGIIINGNAYVPIDLADRLGIDVSKELNVRKVSYKNVVYVRAADLRQSNISVAWDNDTRTVSLRSILPICPGELDRIAGRGKLSDVQLLMFLKANNADVITQYPDMAKLYREEGSIEGINYDIAFSQMCVETNFLRFGNDVKPSQNNFAGLGAIGGGAQGASFASARIGVRAQIQHLKAYANAEPLVQEVVDPRFNFVTRGIAPLVDQLSNRWAADPDYGVKIMSILRRLYESAGFL
jgi:hypothetical protein